MEFGDFYAAVSAVQQAEDVASAYGNTDVRADFTQYPVQFPSVGVQHELLARTHIVQRNPVAQMEMHRPLFLVCRDYVNVVAIYVGQIIGLDGKNPFNAAEQMQRMDTICDFHIETNRKTLKTPAETYAVSTNLVNLYIKPCLNKEL